MKAKIHLLSDLLVAELDDGRRLEHHDAIALAEMLWAHNVTSGEITAVDWHIDAIHAPLSGQKIAIHSLLRSREKRVIQSLPPKRPDELREDQLTKLFTTVQENDRLLRELNAHRSDKKS
jgi:hypothetical protein